MTDSSNPSSWARARWSNFAMNPTPVSRCSAAVGYRGARDAAVGIGTQALGLLALGFRVTGSDLSCAAVNRAQREAAARSFRFPAWLPTSALCRSGRQALMW